MSLYLMLLNLAGSVMLLLWAVRMVRTGVERSQQPVLRRLLRESRGGRMRAAVVGGGMAVLLQSSTAVGLLAAGFAERGLLTLATGIALMLGADMGSALVVRILSFDLQWLVPVLLLAGGGAFFKGKSRAWRQAGRILLGIALILVALHMIGQATMPLRHETAAFDDVLAYLEGDPASAFLIGAAFAWLLHSSVAAVLMIAALAGQGILPAELGVPLVLGVNLGGGLIAFTLTRNSAVEARRIVAGNLAFKGAGAILVLLAFHFDAPLFGYLGQDPSGRVIAMHLAFNAFLLVAGLPIANGAAEMIERWMKPPAAPAEFAAELGSRLDRSVLDRPALAVASAKRELLRMAELIERMLVPLMDLYETGDPDGIRQVKRLEAEVDRAQSDIKLYLAEISDTHTPRDEALQTRALAEFAINLEHVGDAISKTLMKLAETRRNRNLRFSEAGWHELNALHSRVLLNMQLALNVLMSEDPASARQLLAEKAAMAEAERASAGGHLERLRQGGHRSIETSDIHLETVRALKTINSLFASVAYPIVQQAQDGLESA